MPTDYPGAIDPLTPATTPTSPRNSPSLSGKVNDLDATVVALQTKVGVNSSADTNSLDYKVTQNTASIATNTANIVTTAGWLFASGVPAGGTGVNGNVYQDTATGIVYRKTAGSWAAIYTPPAAPSVQPAQGLAGFAAWSYDPATSTNTSTNGSGNVQAHGMYLPAMTVTTLWLNVTTATAATSYMCLYNSAGTLLSQSPGAANVGTTGLKSYALNTPQVVTAGYYYVSHWQTGSPAGLARATSVTATTLNIKTGSALSRCAVLTGLATTTPPSPMGAITDTTALYWVGVS